jgi:N-acetylneuraminate synthase
MRVRPTEISIAKRKIGPNRPVFIIAEAGVNHNGDIRLAKKLIDAAKKVGADAVKFQTFVPEELVTAGGEMAEYQKRNTGKKESQLTMLKKLALSDDEFGILAAYAKKKGIIFLSTAHDGFHSIDLLAKLHVPAFKFGSADINNIPALVHAAAYKKPLLISTGMSDMEEVTQAVAFIRKTGNNDIVVFQCTTDYPARLSDSHLRAMTSMREQLGVIVGFSDHTIGSEAAVIAVTLGAAMLEKHLTLDKHMDGPDHAASADPTEFAAYVNAIHSVETILGSSEKKVTETSKKYRPLVMKSLVARGLIKKGEMFTRNNLAIKRPAGGLSPSYYGNVLGGYATRDLKHDKLIGQGDYVRHK